MQSESVLDDDAFTDWISLYSANLQRLWSKESKELRNFSMVFYVLKEEFSKIATYFDDHLRDFKAKQSDMILTSRTTVDGKDTLQETSNICDITPKGLHSSLKLNKNKHSRKTSFFNKPKSCSVKVCKIQKENVVQPKTISSPELFDSPVIDFTKKTFKGGSKQQSKRLVTDNGDVVESSFFLDSSPDQFISKKPKVKKSSGSTTKIVDFFQKEPNRSRVKKNDFLSLKKKINPFVNDADETFCTFDNKLDNNVQETSKNAVTDEKAHSFFKDYNKFPEPKKKVEPVHVHKTDAVRTKADRLKLPGWSCDDCKKYYEGLDLTTEELRKKMDICSKHRNKFAPENLTPKGFWDISIPATPEPQDYDITYFNLLDD